MVNIVRVYPFHWKLNQCTPENIQSVADGLAAIGADSVFEYGSEENDRNFIL